MSNGTVAAVKADYLSTGGGLGAWWGTSDHKKIAMMFLGLITGAFLVGAIFAVYLKMRMAGGAVPDLAAYHKTMTMHGVVMVFLFLVPALPMIIGYFTLPLQLGARNMALPAFSRVSLRLYVIGLVLVLVSVFTGAASSGWTLSFGGGFMLVMGVGLVFMGVSWALTGINFLVTVHHRRVDGMGFFDMPLTAWGLYLTGYLLTAAGLVFAITVFYLSASQSFGRGLFGPESSPLDWLNYFWFVTTPAAFFALLPAVGVISDVIAGISRKAIAGYRILVGAMIALLALSFTTWGVHMLGSGQADAVSFTFAFFNLLCVVPVALIVFIWLSTLYRGAILCATPTTFVVAFLLNAGIGAVMGLFLSSLSVGSYLANTLFATAHAHYVMMGGVTTALLAGLHWWWPKMTGRLYSHGLGRFSGFLYMVGLNLAFFPQIIMGAKGAPQGAFTADPALAGLQATSGVGMIVLLLGITLIVTNLVRSLLNGAPAGDNPWGASTLEWTTPSPPAENNYDAMPAAGDPYRF